MSTEEPMKKPKGYTPDADGKHFTIKGHDIYKKGKPGPSLPEEKTEKN